MKYNWKTLIAHVDMDAFFASVEQMKDPSLQHKPVVVTSNPNSRTVIAASYEAKKLGYQVGMHVTPSPNVHIKYANLTEYQEISYKIMNCLAKLCAQIEIFSIDEAYLELSGMEHIYPNEEMFITLLKRQIYEQVGLHCSVGLAENKSLAKIASKANKPNGHFMIPPGCGSAYLQDKPVEILCGVGPKMKLFLNTLGIILCGDIHKVPISLLSSKFGQVGREIKRMCLGHGTAVLLPPKLIPKSMGNSKVIKPALYNQERTCEIFRLLSIKLSTRLRAQSLFTQRIAVSIKTRDKIITIKHQFPQGAQCHKEIKDAYHVLLKSVQWPLFVRQIAIRATYLSKHSQEDLLKPMTTSAEHVIDAINARWDNAISIGIDSIRTEKVA
jgi:DNA polymerase-4